MNDICMLVSEFDDKRLAFPCYMDFKLDGVRGFVKYEDKLNIYSRNNKILRNFIIIEKELKILYDILRYDNKVNIDGEILNGHFQNLMRMVSRKIDGVEMALDSTYTIFDIVFKHRPTLMLTERLTYLNSIKNIIKQQGLLHLNINIGKIAYNNHDITKYYDEVRLLGFEGIVIKHLDSIYEFKRSKHWMKRVPIEFIDVVIIQALKGNGKNMNRLGKFICKLPSGIVTKIGGGFTDNEREIFWENRNDLIGKIIEVKFREYTKRGDLRFGEFNRFRDDKDM